jgi:hypothetical protein
VWASAGPAGHAAHPDHPLAASLGAEFAINLNHAHVADNSSPHCLDQFATAVVPRSDIPPIASAAVLTVAGIAGLLIYLAASARRGPPATVVSANAGQDLLTRICSRR